MPAAVASSASSDGSAAAGGAERAALRRTRRPSAARASRSPRTSPVTRRIAAVGQQAPVMRGSRRGQVQRLGASPPCSATRRVSPAACSSMATQRGRGIVSSPPASSGRRRAAASSTSASPAPSARAGQRLRRRPAPGCARRAATSRAVKSTSAWSAPSQSNQDVALSWHRRCCCRPGCARPRRPSPASACRARRAASPAARAHRARAAREDGGIVGRRPRRRGSRRGCRPAPSRLSSPFAALCLCA